ncbi:DUF1613-domain-containing protein [Aaosphaeria arxii CBS 175.79]|uniref:tRNA (uracil-O(2)-)-methyltransferase n=1 Tax=Aaosphaeria arxii CBS 175.79 TaxID=1450172 RepID=A0A6A5XVD4_9PLEO|nr:DUF1613-domain-containing protein [Aaosphaeria arxii CBS 175.79]KAF2017275.1 DUF1613-domain-containing protein [Aaosphaeria arxii CBS 175.79]
MSDDLSPSSKTDAPAVKSIGFKPLDLQHTPTIDSGLPPEIWTIVQSAAANFPPQYFLEVSRSLLENPNRTASHLSRAEISYQSFADASYNPLAQHPHELASIVKHMKKEHQPIIIPGGIPDYNLEWTVVRKLIPRNPKLDEPLIQTCHLFTSTSKVTVREDASAGPNDGSTTIDAERYLVIYLPHVTSPESIPFYHPKIRALAILYTYQANGLGNLSIHYDLFSSYPLDNRLTRTALKMLEVIHKHSRGQEAGYQKRVHHDLIIGQKPFQDTYTFLKGKYAKGLIDNWVEQTLAQKHVFEDLGIAAFLIELWVDMYGGDKDDSDTNLDGKGISGDGDDVQTRLQDARRRTAKKNFPGFVDIGCGNGVLVWILNEEGWRGWGFDARKRKTWDMFGAGYEDKLKEMLLVPEVMNSTAVTSSSGDEQDKNESDPTVAAEEEEKEEEVTTASSTPAHNGIFPTNTFLIANHADELTVWTPILAYLSSSPFIAIPCCSHNFAGTRFRAPHKSTSNIEHGLNFQPGGGSENKVKAGAGKQQQVSAYASFCSYVASLTADVGFVPEKEHLRIPSTRNAAIVGRKRRKADGEEKETTLEEKLEFARGVVENEMPNASIKQVHMHWIKRGDVLMKPGKFPGH